MMLRKIGVIGAPARKPRPALDSRAPVGLHTALPLPQLFLLGARIEARAPLFA